MLLLALLLMLLLLFGMSVLRPLRRSGVTWASPLPSSRSAQGCWTWWWRTTSFQVRQCAAFTLLQRSHCIPTTAQSDGCQRCGSSRLQQWCDYMQSLLLRLTLVSVLVMLCCVVLLCPGYQAKELKVSKQPAVGVTGEGEQYGSRLEQETPWMIVVTALIGTKQSAKA